MEKKLIDIFDVVNEYIKKTKLEVQEMQKQSDRKMDKVKSLQKAIIILQEHIKYG